ncbi:MAG: DUF748 domain-containing protein [Desulfuromonadaceae bacterium]
MPETAPEPVTQNSPPHGKWRPRVLKSVRLLLYTAAVILLILTLLPAGLRLGAEHWLNKQPGIAAEIGNIDLNLFSATFVLEDLRIEYAGTPHARVERLAIGAKYLPLWHKQAFIDYVELDGVLLVLEQDKNEMIEPGAGLRIGGLPLPRTAAEKQNAEPQAEEETATPWGFGWNHIEIGDAEIVWRQPEWSADLVIEQAHFNDVASWLPDNISELRLQLRLNDAPVAISAQTRPFASRRSARGHVQVEGFDLSKLAHVLAPVGIHDLNGIFSCDLEHEISLENLDDIRLQWNGDLELQGAELSTPELYVAHAALYWNGTGAVSTATGDITRISVENHIEVPILDAQALASGMALHQEGLSWDGDLESTLEPGKTPDIHFNGDLKNTGMRVTDQNRGRLLASWDTFESNGVAFRDMHLEIEQLSLANLVALRPSSAATDSEPPLIRCDHLRLQDLSFDPGRGDKNADVALKALELEGLGMKLIRYASGHMNIEQWSSSDVAAANATQDSEPSEAPEEIPSAEGESPASALSWRVGKIHIHGDSYVHFTDINAEPDVNIELNAIDLRVDELDSAAADTRNPIRLDARPGRFATLNAHGNISVLAPQPEGSMDLKLQGFQLYSIAPYIEEVIGARVETGELDFVGKASLEDNILMLESSTNLRSFTLGEMTAAQQERISANLGMPLSLALALLRDKNGDIHLDIPISGDLSSPDIAIGPVVRKALFGAVQETIKLALKPLGILSGAGKLLGIGGELKLQPLEFAPGEKTLTAAETNLKPLRELLGQRPHLRVILSAPLTLADIEALQAQHDTARTDNQEKTRREVKKGEKQELSEEQLRTLAIPVLQERLYRVKGWLLDTGEVHNNQVLLTQPRLNTETGKPRVEMRF